MEGNEGGLGQDWGRGGNFTSREHLNIQLDPLKYLIKTTILSYTHLPVGRNSFLLPSVAQGLSAVALLIFWIR